MSVTASATHCHIAAGSIVGSTFPIPGNGLFRQVTDVTEFCACGARRSAPEYTDAEGLTSFGKDVWSGGLPGM